MPAAQRPPRTDHPADASPPADAPAETASTNGDATDAVASNDGAAIEWTDADDRPSAGLTHPGRLLETELECARLRARVLELEAALEARDRERQDVIDRYERVLAERDRPTPAQRQSFADGLFERLRSALASRTR